MLDVVSLCRCAQVSRQWHDLALHGSNWQRVDLFEFQVAIEVGIGVGAGAGAYPLGMM